MRLVIADIRDLQGHLVWQLVLDGDVPLVDDRVPEVRRQTAEADGRRQRKDVYRVTGLQAAGEVRVGVEQLAPGPLAGAEVR